MKLAIVGLGPSSHTYIEDVDRAGDRKKLFDETWTFNSYASVIDSDRLFHMDDVKVQEARAAAGNVRVKNMLEALKRYKGPIYTSTPEPDYPTMIPYPLQTVIQYFQSFYFTTTPPYAAALAPLEGFTEIWFYGMDYVWPGLAAAEAGRACMEYWVGRIQGLGCKIHVPPTTTLLDSKLSTKNDIKLYGYDRHKIRLEDRGNGKVAMLMEPKPLPTAEEIEERYNHRKPASAVALDVVN